MKKNCISMRFDPVTRNDNLFKNYRTSKKRDDTFLDTYWLERRIGLRNWLITKAFVIPGSP